ncbi:MAG: membrane-bound PQQ-dependent dehydrogenase, glucose/quinate/shikimate family [Proteobacteria bacterium]|nr:membrane-bound PQQ-dependent dehydrogenase, glucose/quinate/shikimate family [Pseudomonadota bacterium]
MTANRGVRPPRLFPILLVLLALPFTVMGWQLNQLGGSSYYLLASVMLLLSAFMLWRGSIVGSWLYGMLLFGTIVWSFQEAGVDPWALAPRILPMAVLGLWLLTPWLRRSLYGPQVSPLHSSVVVRGIAVFVAIGVVFVLAAGSSYTVNPVPDRAGQTRVNSNTDWPAYGNTRAGSRYSPMDQINPDTVGDLELAWTYRTAIGGSLKGTPIQVDDLLYVCAGSNVVIALDAESGERRWQYDPQIPEEVINASGGRYYRTGCRAVTYYQAPESYRGECQQRTLTATTDARLIALDARNGQPCISFGYEGEVDLSVGMGTGVPISYMLTSPPAIVSGNAVIGGWVRDNMTVGEPSGVIRAFNAISGDFAWAWDMGRPGINSEPAEGEEYTRATPNVWSLFSVDEEREMVFAPTGNETPDFFGAQRLDVSEQFSAAIVALDGRDGSLRWSFQTVHHDIWDYDIPSQPTLIDIPGPNGEIIPALLAPTKRGEIFMLNRVNGEPIAGVEERPVPQQGKVAEEWLSPTQPFSLFPDFRGPDLSEADMWGITPYDQLWCRIEYKKLRYEGHFTPPGTDWSLYHPGNSGGFNWGSISVDEANHLLVANPLLMANIQRLIPRSELPAGAQGNQLGTPYAHATSRFISPLEIPCFEPPYGVLALVDLVTLEVLWKRPIGTAKESGPWAIPTRLPVTVGTPQMGGTVITAGGLIFHSGAFDNTVRAIRVENGEELWSAPLPWSAHATPMVYRAPQSGKQTLIVTVPVYNTNSAVAARVTVPENEDPLGGYIMAYRLPD